MPPIRCEEHARADAEARLAVEEWPKVRLHWKAQEQHRDDRPEPAHRAQIEPMEYRQPRQL